MGPLMLDVSACELSAEERDILGHPLVGGVILFSRNYHDKGQLAELVRQTRAAARHPILVAVDHEGGRVQRFRSEFSPIPSMGRIFTQAQQDLNRGADISLHLGWLMATELREVDIDLSFAPVLDIQGISDVIGDRSFHADGEVIIKLAAGFIQGMRQAGMKATGKHFPGHGNVKEDSHVAMPVDRRSSTQIFNEDMAVFQGIQQQGLLDAVMPAHVVYPDVDDLPASCSTIWLQQILRQQMGFEGVIFSDDLSMHGASQLGGYLQRAEKALQAGCDMVLVCNQPAGAVEVLDGLPQQAQYSQRIASMAAGASQLPANLSVKQRLEKCQQFIRTFDE